MAAAVAAAAAVRQLALDQAVNALTDRRYPGWAKNREATR